MNKKAVVEGILFIIGEDGIDLDKLAELLEENVENLNKIIDSLKEDYNSSERGIQIVKFGGKIKLATKEEHRKYYEKLNLEDSGILSQAALETLAIIAYNQPITRVKIDEIRGISSSHMVRKLLSRDLIKEVGKSDDPGRPNLYSVTDMFLDYFGLESVDELPELKEVEIEDTEEDLFESKYKEDIEAK